MPDAQRRKAPAVIIGLETLQGLQTARILARHDVPVIAIADDASHFCCRTNVCKETHIADTRSEAFLATLSRICAEMEERPVLYPCRDESVLALSRNRHSLQEKCRFLLPDEETVEMLYNKTSFYQFAERNDFTVPKTYAVHNTNELSAALEGTSFPCIFKPPQRSQAWTKSSAYKALKINSAEEASSLYEACRHWTGEVLVQEWIAGEDDELYSCNCYFDASGEPLVTFVARKIRQWPPGVGESSLGIECREDDVLNETVRLFRKVNFKGLGYLEIKREQATGRYVIIEPNIGRPTGRSAIAEAAGVDLIYTMYSDLAGYPLPERREQKYSGVKWVHLTRDTASALDAWRREQLTLRQWVQSLRGKKAYAVFAWSDPGPFVGDLLRAIKMLMSSKERRRRRVAGKTSVPVKPGRREKAALETSGQREAGRGLSS